ncbi:hypothetical protein KCU65_g1285, partial [Aureobasidium melanogenum]
MSEAYVHYQEEYNKPKKRRGGRRQKFLDPETEPNVVKSKEQVAKAEDVFKRAKADVAPIDILQDQQDRIKVLAMDRDLCRSGVQGASALGWAKRRSERMKEGQPKTPEPEVESLKVWRSGLEEEPDSEPPSKRQKKVETSGLKKDDELNPESKDQDLRLPNIKTIMIDNSTLLVLWAALVTQTLNYPDWDKTCLSAGNTISRLIRDNITYDIDQAKEKIRSDNRRITTFGMSATPKELETMGFTFMLKADVVVLGQEVISGDENTLKSKFASEDDYEVLKSWLQKAVHQLEKNELMDKAMELYKCFESIVEQGQDHWSTKTELNVLRIHAGTQKICNSSELGTSNWKVEEDLAE